LKTQRFAWDRKKKHQHLPTSFVASVKGKTKKSVSRVVVYRQVLRKLRPTCPYKCEDYLTRVCGEHNLLKSYIIKKGDR